MKLNIILASDNHGSNMMSVAAYSIIKNNSDHDLHFYIIHNDISNANIKRVKLLEKKFSNASISFVPVNKEDFKDIQVTNKAVAMPAYYRYLAPEILLKEHRALYIDSDMLCLGDLKDLYNTKLSGNYVGAVADYWISKKDEHGTDFRVGIGLGKDDQYANSGLLLMDLDKLRGSKIMETFWYNIRNKDKVIPAEFNVFADQTVTNITFKGKIKFLDKKYNVFTTALKYTEQKNPVIIHFTGPHKPLTYRDAHTSVYDEIYYTYYHECMQIIGDDNGALVKNALKKLNQDISQLSQELHELKHEKELTTHNIWQLTTQLTDKEQELDFLHREQRDIRFLTKRLIVESQTRIARRAKGVASSEHLRYKTDNRIKELLKGGDSPEDMISKVHELDKKNVILRKARIRNKLKPILWSGVNRTLNLTVKAGKKVAHRVK